MPPGQVKAEYKLETSQVFPSNLPVTFTVTYSLAASSAPSFVHAVTFPTSPDLYSLFALSAKQGQYIPLEDILELKDEIFWNR